VAAPAAEAAEGAAPRKLSSPFPPPTAKFPPPAGARKPDAVVAKKAPVAGKKSLLPILGIVALVVLGGAFFAYRKLTAEPPPPPPRPVAKKPAVPAPEPAATVQQTLDKAKQDQMAPLNEVVGADQAATTPPAAKPADGQPAPDTTAVTAPIPVTPVAPPPPPPASLPFKAWVQNLRIGGMRGGANPRVFIEHTAYAPGDVVNPSLGIIFVGYNPETRMLVFKDKTGATVELRY
jgi:hypothetical protein